MKTLVILMAAVLVACSPPAPLREGPASEHIRYNQAGYVPGSVKEFVVADLAPGGFRVYNEKGKAVFKGKLADRGRWDISGEEILTGDFSPLTRPGTYYIVLDNGAYTEDFMIRPGLYREALDAAIKSYYFQRASMAIEERFGGIFSREAGHPDLGCPYHPSTGKKGGSLDSPGGWYDAGDYGKYVVNAAISVGQMQDLLELYPGAIPDARLNIPESGNGISDLMDEIRYELNWLVTMQDEDGGVFHKLTAAGFAGFVMPAEYDLERLVIGKGTFSSLTFAAVMAQAARVFQQVDPEWAAGLLEKAVRAWDWSRENPEDYFRNPKDVFTGEYGDDDMRPDFYWAAAELYVSTGDAGYLSYLEQHEEPYIHQETNSWKFFIRNMGFHTLLVNSGRIDPELADSLKEKHLELSSKILDKLMSIPYHVGVDHFEWGSNSDVLNQAMILCLAHHLSGEQAYLDGAIRSMDYIFGKNATGYCFLTGTGAKQVMHPHHRPSGADGIEAPVPGFIVGGPNKDRQDKRSVEYSSDYPAKAYEDVEASFASNEVCLNWNAPAVFVMGYLEQVLP
jgi:endoglucanase